ncbi:MAG: methylated-DNA--[protein]-cysteine S-methyltransferase [Halioglobus sp.]
MTRYQYFECGIGTLRLVCNNTGLTHIEFDGQHRVAPQQREQSTPLLADCARQLGEYFAGQRKQFELPLAPEGTEFQRDVWRALDRIPYGELRSYQDIAREIGRDRAVRAVGAANGRNPLPIVLPCHRVVGSNGKLTGFAGGLKLKARLLQLEGALQA